MDEKFIELDLNKGNLINPLEIENRLPLREKILNVEEIRSKKQEIELELDQKEIQEALDVVNNVTVNLPEVFFGRIDNTCKSTIKAKDANHELYLIRFAEGTNFYDHPVEEIIPIRWKANPFIPVIGIEVKKAESKRILNRIQQLEGYFCCQSVRLFHDYSFMTI